MSANNDFIDVINQRFSSILIEEFGWQESPQVLNEYFDVLANSMDLGFQGLGNGVEVLEVTGNIRLVRMFWELRFDRSNPTELSSQISQWLDVVRRIISQRLPSNVRIDFCIDRSSLDTVTEVRVRGVVHQ